MLLTAQNIYKNFGNVEVLKGVNMAVGHSEIVSIVGASGAGKSTLLYILGTLDKPDKGVVRLNNETLAQLNDIELAALRNSRIGFVFQFHNLLPEFTALENICIPAMIAGVKKPTAENRALEILKLLNMEHRAHHKPSELSGGEQQRVAVARALINSPKIVFADEPSGNLDSKNAEELHKLFFRLRDELGLSFVIVTHNHQLAEMADRKLIMADGNIV